MTILSICQDGNQFYDDQSGEVVFETNTVLHDGDIEGAEIAKKLCIQHFNMEGADVYFPSFKEMHHD